MKLNLTFRFFKNEKKKKKPKTHVCISTTYVNYYLGNPLLLSPSLPAFPPFVPFLLFLLLSRPLQQKTVTVSLISFFFFIFPIRFFFSWGGRGEKGEWRGCYKPNDTWNYHLFMRLFFPSVWKWQKIFFYSSPPSTTFYFTIKKIFRTKQSLVTTLNNYYYYYCLLPLPSIPTQPLPRFYNFFYTRWYGKIIL